MAERWGWPTGSGITRDLDWGVPVKRGDADWPGMEGKVFYVWFDAPSNTSPVPKNGLMRAKAAIGNVGGALIRGPMMSPIPSSWAKITFRFTPCPSATILGSGEPWKLVDYIKSFNYLNYDGGQFSTSRGRGVFMDQALEILPADYWRWWLLSNAPESSDAEFTWENFQANVNKDLADVLGNFVSRITKFCRSKFGEVVPEGGSYGEQEEKLIADITARLRDYETHMNAMTCVRQQPSCARFGLRATNTCNPPRRGPRLKRIRNRRRAGAFGSEPDPFICCVIRPFIPSTAARMMEAMQTTDDTWPSDVAEALSHLTAGHEFSVPDVLFAKITDEQREEWQDRFAGTRD